MKHGAFSYANFRALLSAAERAGRKFATVSGCLTTGASASTDTLLLRHDVDRWTAQAVRMAQFEHALGIRATYYFRSSRDGGFPAAAIERIHRLGHECGYHYETLSRHGGDRGRAMHAFERTLEYFRAIVPCATVSAHGAPLSRHDNLTLLVDEDPARFGLIGEAVHSFRDVAVVYFTDSGGAWNASRRRNLRDRFFDQAVSGLPLPTSSEAFERVLVENRCLVYLTTHPERWAGTPGLALVCAARDLVGMSIKTGLATFRQLSDRQEAGSR